MPRFPSFNARRSLRPWLVTVAITAILSAGCVQRRMTIRSNPPGAQVYIDDQEIGRTPVSTDFIYYGNRDIRLVKDGYETLTIKQPVRPPWYEWPGLEFVSENLWPGEIRDERVFDYPMQPALVVPSQTLLSRAEELRRAQVTVQVVPGAAPVMQPGMVVQPGVVGQPGVVTQPPGVGVPTLPPTSPYAVPTPQPTPQYIRPPAVLNYPPSAGAEANASGPLPPPPANYVPPVVPETHFPGDFGGRPVPPMP